MLRFACPKCRHKMGCRPDEAGLTITCARCGQRMQIPSSQPARPATIHPASRPTPATRDDPALPRAVPVSGAVAAPPPVRRRPSRFLWCAFAVQAVVCFCLGAFSDRLLFRGQTPAEFAQAQQVQPTSETKPNDKLPAADKTQATPPAKPPEPEGKAATTPPAEQAVTPSPAEPLVAADLYAEYIANPEAAEKKYHGKRLRVRGRVIRTLIPYGAGIIAHLDYPGRPDDSLLASQIVIALPFDRHPGLVTGYVNGQVTGVQIPWKDNPEFTFTATCFMSRSNPDGSPHITFRGVDWGPY